MERLGVMLCTGCGIGDSVDTSALEGMQSELGAVKTVTHEMLCGPEGLAAIRAAMDEDNLDGLLIGACSSRAKVNEFRFLDREGFAVERVSLREQVIWSHPAGEEDTQALAEDLMRMGAVRLQKTSLPEKGDEEVSNAILVVGGGLAGLTAARAAAGCGYPVTLLEKDETLGGYLAPFREIPPQEAPYDRAHENPIPALVKEVEEHDGIRVLTSARPAEVNGQPGQFDVKVDAAAGEETFRVGAIVQATGALPYDANRLANLGYADNADVITNHELERMLASGELKRPSNGSAPGRVLFVQCAGSRDADHLPYCSSECCLTSLKQMDAIHKLMPEVETAMVYRDMRTPGQTERYYIAVQEHPKSFLTRGDVEKVAGDGNGTLAVHVKNSLLGDEVVLPSDLVVLAVGMVPRSADGEGIRIFRDAKQRTVTGESETQKKDAQAQMEEYARHEGTEILNLTYRQGPDLPVIDKSFPDSHYICFPYETRRTGIYTTGSLRAPMEAGRASEDGWGAAMKAMQAIEMATQGQAVHPRSGDISLPSFFLQRCTQCKRCTEECPFGTLNEDEKGTPEFNPLRCRRCGICMGACPERIISFADYSVDMVAGMIKAMEVPDEFEEKPRILALLCENDALPAMDAAAGKRHQWNAWLRVIPIRCLGSSNNVWISEAFNKGIDGVIMIGCRSGDDYQCHYIRGSELATTRLTNIKETLDRMFLESERVRVVELGHNEFDRIPEVLADFAETVEELGPNPMKGF